MTTQTLSVGSNPGIEIEHVGGDLVIEGWDRTDLEARSDAVQEIEQDGQTVRLSCSSDLSISIPRGSNVELSFVGGDVRISDVNGRMEISFVGGDALLRNLTGQVLLAGVVGGETRMENVSKVSMEPNKGGSGADISAKIRRRVDEAMRRAERKMREAEQKARHVEIKMQSNDRRVRSATRRMDFGFDSVASADASQPVSDEERMTILKMLQEKKITSEEADKLLAALEGGV